jgi:hypothetical protein
MGGRGSSQRTSGLGPTRKCKVRKGKDMTDKQRTLQRHCRGISGDLECDLEIAITETTSTFTMAFIHKANLHHGLRGRHLYSTRNGNLDYPRPPHTRCLSQQHLLLSSGPLDHQSHPDDLSRGGLLGQSPPTRGCTKQKRGYIKESSQFSSFGSG